MQVTPTLHEVLHTAEDLVLVMDCVAGCELFELIDAQGALPAPVVCSLMAHLPRGHPATAATTLRSTR